MARMSSPTGKNHVVKVLENFGVYLPGVLQYLCRREVDVLELQRGKCAIAHTGHERKGDQGTVALVDLGGVWHDGEHAPDLLQSRHRPLAPGFGDPRVLL